MVVTVAGPKLTVIELPEVLVFCPSLPQTKNSLLVLNALVLRLFVVSVLVNDIATILELLTLLDCFWVKSESSSLPIPAIS